MGVEAVRCAVVTASNDPELLAIRRRTGFKCGNPIDHASLYRHHGLSVPHATQDRAGVYSQASCFGNLRGIVTLQHSGSQYVRRSNHDARLPPRTSLSSKRFLCFASQFLAIREAKDAGVPGVRFGASRAYLVEPSDFVRDERQSGPWTSTALRPAVAASW
jgi:hypothetical protein